MSREQPGACGAAAGPSCHVRPCVHLQALARKFLGAPRSLTLGPFPASRASLRKSARTGKGVVRVERLKC